MCAGDKFILCPYIKMKKIYVLLLSILLGWLSVSFATPSMEDVFLSEFDSSFFINDYPTVSKFCAYGDLSNRFSDCTGKYGTYVQRLDPKIDSLLERLKPKFSSVEQRRSVVTSVQERLFLMKKGDVTVEKKFVVERLHYRLSKTLEKNDRDLAIWLNLDYIDTSRFPDLKITNISIFDETDAENKDWVEVDVVDINRPSVFNSQTLEIDCYASNGDVENYLWWSEFEAGIEWATELNGWSIVIRIFIDRSKLKDMEAVSCRVDPNNMIVETNESNNSLAVLAPVNKYPVEEALEVVKISDSSGNGTFPSNKIEPGDDDNFGYFNLEAIMFDAHIEKIMVKQLGTLNGEEFGEIKIRRSSDHNLIWKCKLSHNEYCTMETDFHMKNSLETFYIEGEISDDAEKWETIEFEIYKIKVEDDDTWDEIYVKNMPYVINRWLIVE